MSGALRLMVEIVTDLVFGDNGVATGKGTGDHELEPVVGWHFGFYSRPLDGATGFVVKADGQGNTALLFTYGDKQYVLSLEKGEVGAKNAFDAYWLLNKDGVLELNGTDFSLPKTEDLLTALAGLTQAVGTVLSAATDTGIVAAMAATPAPPILDPSLHTPYATNSAAIIGLLASATPYKSTKAKNG